MNDSELPLPPVSVMAPSPIAAAEAVYKGKLATAGKPPQLRARVWHLADDYSTGLLEFYDPEKSERLLAPTPPRRTMKIAMMSSLLCLGVCVVAGILYMAG